MNRSFRDFWLRGFGLVGVALSASMVSAQDSIKAVVVEVAAANDEWTSTGIKVAQGDLVLILASGTVKIGQLTGTMDADGMTGSGQPTNLAGLQVKIGAATTLPIGKRSFLQPDEAGPIKVRLKDSRYDDNSGSFSVTIYRIPAGFLPPPEPYSGDQ